ncbi:MAG: penicillin-binding protein 2 [Actinobacteria bacterium]|nr:penicillin-binding protein 2 [Actinomycetota bacterium]MCB8996995.1 penicillin-binding protein 2 [Actinomycetota bacterium]MCB9414014.1 penicillin-binding protein 2 [Actinomycetota bacterium]MCB9424523.1 penicillin-binding protein 2 [Actinomycetota bacterium]HRY08633.1 penicillin-binding transpeptidase domain-containing protein [Candidatus Nanopelagicales bacterium]
MIRAIRRLGWVFGILSILLSINLTFQQFILAPKINAQPGNQRTVLAEYERERGPILVGTKPVARSVATPKQTFKFLRTYSDGVLYAPATGFYSSLYGSTGLERTENEILSGNDPRLFVDRIEQLVAGRVPEGGAVQTTLVASAQKAAASGLGDNIGSVTAIDPKTGAILALVQSPSFDPNGLSTHDAAAAQDYYEQLEADPDKPLLNRPLVQTIPPGSTFKLVTAAAALEAGYEPDSSVPGPALYPLPGSTKSLPNWFRGPCGPNDTTTLAEALAVSCNTAFAYLGNELGADALRTQSNKFGFESSFDVPMTAATSRFPDDPDDAQTAMSAIGQFDVAATSLQMAMVTASIANQGVTMYPYLVNQVLAPDLTVLSQTQPREFERAMTEQNAGKLMGMMVRVVSSGTGSNARISGVNVGGKTGTAETGAGRPNIAWFVAAAPAEDPQVAVAVAVENTGQPEVSGNQVAAPIARAVIEAVLQR